MLSFSEYCKNQLVMDIPDWQKQFLDRWYESFKERRMTGEKLILNIPRKNGKSSMQSGLLRMLVKYLYYLEGENNNGQNGY